MKKLTLTIMLTIPLIAQAEKASIYPSNIKIACGDSTAELITQPCFENNIKESLPQTGIPICTQRQKLKFNNGSEMYLPSKKIHLKTKQDKDILLIDRVASTIGCVQTKNESYIWISSYKGCNSCGEWFGLADKKGALIFDSDKSSNDPRAVIKKLGAKKNWENNLQDINF